MVRDGFTRRVLATCVLAVAILGPNSAAAQDADEPDVVEALIGSEFRYGPIDRWVFCDGEQPCQMAYPGTHVSLLRATPNDDGDELHLRLARTGGEDGGVWRTFGSIRVRQVEGRWRLVDAS
jgi:hypothetical protein